MIPHEVLETAQAYRLLAELEPRQLTKLLPLAQDTDFARDQIIFPEGARSTHLYLIVGGTVALETMAAGRPIQVQTINAGEVMGWSSLTDDGLTHFQARALTQVSTIAFPGDKLREACEIDPELGYALTKQLLDLVTGRLDATRMQLVDMYAKPEPRRT